MAYHTAWICWGSLLSLLGLEGAPLPGKWCTHDNWPTCHSRAGFSDLFALEQKQQTSLRRSRPIKHSNSLQGRSLSEEYLCFKALVDLSMNKHVCFWSRLTEHTSQLQGYCSSACFQYFAQRWPQLNWMLAIHAKYLQFTHFVFSDTPARDFTRSLWLEHVETINMCSCAICEFIV